MPMQKLTIALSKKMLHVLLRVGHDHYSPRQPGALLQGGVEVRNGSLVFFLSCSLPFFCEKFVFCVCDQTVLIVASGVSVSVLLLLTLLVLVSQLVFFLVSASLLVSVSLLVLRSWSGWGFALGKARAAHRFRH